MFCCMTGDMVDNPIPGIYIEETAGVVLLFWFGYILLFFFLRHLIRSGTMSRWILPEGIWICLLADRFLAIYVGECYRLTMEWEPYFRRWQFCVFMLILQIAAGAAALRWCKQRRSRSIAFGCIAAVGVLLYAGV